MGAENFSMTNTIRKDLESYNKNEVARPRFLLVIISSILIIQCASQNADKIKKDDLLHESHSFCNILSIIGYILHRLPLCLIRQLDRYC